MCKSISVNCISMSLINTQHMIHSYTRVCSTSQSARTLHCKKCLKMPSKWENLAHNGLISFVNIITYLLSNSDYGIGCVYSPLGLVIFVAVEGTFVRFTKGYDHFISNSIRCGRLRKDQCNIACLQTEMHWKYSARRRRTVPCDLRRASLSVPPLFL